MSERENLEKQAQEKLSQARRLIREAGELAKQGQFPLHFGEIGNFIPRSAIDRGLLREQAIENLKAAGTEIDPPWEKMSEDEREVAVDEEISGIQDSMDIPWEFREYADESDADQWWHPSRC